MVNEYWYQEDQDVFLKSSTHSRRMAASLSHYPGKFYFDQVDADGLFQERAKVILAAGKHIELNL